MATLLQQKTAKILSDLISSPNQTSKVLTKKEILKRAGYSETTIKRPSQVFKSKGLKELLKEYGITKEDRLLKLGEIMKGKDKRSAISAIAEINKMLGDYAPVKQEISDLRENRKEIIEPE